MNECFLTSLASRAQKLSLTLALPESLDDRTLTAAATVLANCPMVRVVFFEEKEKISRRAEQLACSLAAHEDRITIASDAWPDLLAEVAASRIDSCQAKQKPCSPADALKFATSPLNQAGFLLASGRIHSVLAGATNTTADVIRAGLATVGAAPYIRTISGAFIMARSSDKRVYLYADCGVVADPVAEELVEIATASVDTWRALMGKDTPPVVAFLSFSTTGSARHPHVEKVALAAKLFREKHPSIASGGEMQFDAAFDPKVGERKMPGNPVSGKANIFIFPTLDSGNIAYKITERLAGFGAYGPILQGLAKPFSDLSRGANVESIVASAYINLLRVSDILRPSP